MGSQDCDVVHVKYTVEPKVEIIRAVRRKKLDGNLVFAKSARKLQFELSSQDGIEPYELSIHERWSVDRRILEDADPDQDISLSEGQKKQLSGWLAKRYRRDAFPDAFVNRLKEQPHSENLRNLFKDWGQWISGVYLVLDTDEDLPPEQPYVAVAWATVLLEDYEDEKTLERLNDEFQPLLEKALGAFTGIEVRDAMVVSEADFSLADIRRTRRMDLDDLSYRDDGPIVGDD